MATIERDIYLSQRRRVEPISIVYGSAVPIKLNLADYTIPANASIVFYAQCGQNPVYRCTGTASGNSATFTQPEGFFQPGENVLQMEINGRLIPLALPVYCQERLSGAGSTATPEQVRPYVLQAQDAATDAQTAAGQAQSSAQNAQTSASQANTYKSQAQTAATTAQAAAQTAQNASVRTPYVGNNNHWFVFDAETNTYVDSGVNSVGATGPAATLVSSTVQYKASSSGTTIPTGTWSTSVPSVAQGQYLWTKTTQTFNTGNPVVSYSVSRMGLDGSGSVVSVCDVAPDASGNVALTAEDVGARPDDWMPTAADVGARPDTWTPTAADVGAATPSEVNAAVKKAAPRNLLDNSDFTNLVAQAGIGGNHGTVAYAADRWILTSGTVSYTAGAGLTLTGTITQKLENAPAAAYPYVGMASGTASINYANGTVTITSGGGVIKWAALYEGEYTTETLPEYQPKGYGAEMAECQRYYFRWIPTYSASALGYVVNWTATSARAVIYLPATMRNQGTLPTISFTNLRIAYRSSSANITLSSVSAKSESGNILYIESTITNGTAGEVGYLTADDTVDAYIGISKDL